MLPPVPDGALGKDGLLVAHIYVPDSPMWHNAEVHTNTGYLGHTYNGNIAMTLPAGAHSVDQLALNRQFLGAYAYRDSRLEVGRNFVIEPGKITNLGLIVYLPVENSDSSTRGGREQRRQYRTVATDNMAEIRHYLEIHFPKSLASASNRSFFLPDGFLATGAYLPSRQLPVLRQTIASLEQRQRKKLISNSTLSVVYGDAGTIAIYRGGTQFDLLETGTLADIADACRDGEKLIFVASDGKLLTLENGKLTGTTFPQAVDPLRVTSRNGSVVVVGDRLQILISKDGGRSWDAYLGAARENRMRGIDLALDSEGVYVYSGFPGPPNSISFVPYGRAAPRRIDPPQYSWNFEGDPQLIARDTGLFVIPWKGRSFYFRPRSAEGWEKRSTPDYCDKISFEAGEKLRTVCGGQMYESSDGGLNWSTRAFGT